MMTGLGRLQSKSSLEENTPQPSECFGMGNVERLEFAKFERVSETDGRHTLLRYYAKNYPRQFPFVQEWGRFEKGNGALDVGASLRERAGAREYLQNTHEWCRCKLSAFREKRMWPGRSLNLNPTQKLQGISLQELESRSPFISLWQLTERRKSVSANIFGAKQRV